MNRHLAVIAMTAALAACGGGGGDGDSGMASTPPDTTTPARGDSFVSSVLALISGGSDSAEPASVDAFSATTPEDTEPQPVS